MTKEEKYIACLREMDIRLQEGGDLIADLGNITAILRKRMDHYFWVGFYFLKENQLVLGPFQGTPACVFLNLETGVCAACAREKKVILVPDVHDFPGHVACDPHSKSEIVVPVFDKESHLFAVLDVDSSEVNAFDEMDERYLKEICDKIKDVNP